jgi:DNA-binding CsgD family transcriptional regulator
MSVQENIEAALRGEEIQPYELSHIKPSGEILWLEVNIAPLRRDGRIVGVLGVSRNITYRKRIEQAKDKAREQLEEEVDRRTRDLWEANYLLEQEIEDRKRAENILRQREQELNTNAARLEELNTALKILVKRREKDRLELEQRLLRNVRELVLPYVEKLENSGLNSTQKAYLDIIRSNLDEILSPFSHRLSTDYLRMTPKEIDIANLIKQGKTTKEVAFLMKMSKRTVEAHRDRIRRKLGLRHRKINLRTHLLAIQ